MPFRFEKGFFLIALFCLVWFQGMAISQELNADDLAALEARIKAFRPNPEFKDDKYGLIVVKLGMASLKDGSGGIGACLVNEKTGEVVAEGRNRQYSPYFRSDLHAEMDLLTRWEDWLRKKGRTDSGFDPRKCDDLVLISSMEPCPMCLTRIINSGIKKMVYLAPDPDGGMVSRMDCLPPFWKRFAADRDFRQASCSPELRRIADALFNHSKRTFAKKKNSK